MRLPFELDPQIIHHIIYSQAGSIGKAIIELIMNSADAGASAVSLTMTKAGFHCSDDGSGFVSRDDVLRYFGRFGTPHAEGDATYGRFRLGRGQIMAHATTDWVSNSWSMKVDTRTMGYNYELEDLTAPSAGCSITGTWYEQLNDLEVMSAVQEIRDLVRYTPISVELNGRVITRDPAKEKWDFEDQWAYYRAKEDGPVSIYNQGVLVRNDSSHVWGAGGLIVSKKAIDLNVSRTEILRKTCPVWKVIAKEFGRLADSVSARLGDHRKTEARREKSARALLSGDANICTVYEREEVITLLPGKRHVTLMEFHSKAQHSRLSDRGTYTLVEESKDVPKGEAIAREEVIQIVHPKTLERFGCHNFIDFEEALERAFANVSAELQAIENRGERAPWYSRRGDISNLQLVAFSTYRDAFIERTQIVDERKVLDKETRRAWIALRWCLQHYAGACAGANRYRDGTLCYDEKRLHVLLGESNNAEAWTDGETYLAIDCAIVKRISSKPLETVAYIFGLVEHEVAHKGDSIDCGHDEAFYQRYHDISLRMAPERQRFMHKWLMKYTMSMENEGKKARGHAWNERWLVDRAGSGRVKRGLSPVIEDVSAHPLVIEPVPGQNMALLSMINARLVETGACPEPPNWDLVREQARLDQVAVSNELRADHDAQKAEHAEFERHINEMFKNAEPQIATALNLELAAIPPVALNYLVDCFVCQGYTPDEIRAAWDHKEWDYDAYPDNHEYPEQEINPELYADTEMENAEPSAALWRVDEDCRQYVKDGETWWMLERNSAAAGFFRVEDYLKWRHADQVVADGVVS
ncbi:ATP-binding protein [Pseudomonas fluorescens]|uniref:ATP-binding protein n=1 Tax=Pseudomonas fluorescens TaxID=294 RepID=A0A2T0HN04_PSEFL|nr:ATP-binding protein [Pseudomonas fluorescens]PRW84485.1 ATP-binding protein [Pseudomonas fluorescens]